MIAMGGVTSTSKWCVRLAMFPALSLAWTDRIYVPPLRLLPCQYPFEQLTGPSIEPPYVSTHSHVTFSLASHEMVIFSLLTAGICRKYTSGGVISLVSNVQ